MIFRRRNDQVDELRGIDEIFEDDDDENGEELMEVVEHCRKRYKRYHSRLMLSEWMCEVPVDLEENWLFKICPVGVRNIVVANKVSLYVPFWYIYCNEGWLYFL